jgi:hypothetical protein
VSGKSWFRPRPLPRPPAEWMPFATAPPADESRSTKRSASLGDRHERTIRGGQATLNGVQTLATRSAPAVRPTDAGPGAGLSGPRGPDYGDSVSPCGQGDQWARLVSNERGRRVGEKPAPAPVGNGRGGFRTSDLSRVKSAEAVAVCCQALPFVPGGAGFVSKVLPRATFCCHSLFPTRFQTERLMPTPAARRHRERRGESKTSDRGRSSRRGP